MRFALRAFERSWMDTLSNLLLWFECLTQLRNSDGCVDVHNDKSLHVRQPKAQNFVGGHIMG
jgi:hypothetical protein